MKRTLILAACTAVTMAGLLQMPQIVSASLPEVTVVQMEAQTYQDKITAVGKVEEVDRSDIKTELPVVTKEVFVQVGDTVQTGDVLAEIDVERTKQSLLSMASMYNILPKEVVSVLSAVELKEELLAELIPTKILADYSGTISSLNLQKGAMTSPTETVATIANLRELRVSVNIPEEYAHYVELKQKVTMKVGALNNQNVKGTVDRIAPVASETLVGTNKQVVMGVYVALDEQYPDLKSGYSVNATIELGEEEDIYTVPYAAVNQEDDGTEYVLLYDSGKAKKRMIVTGREQKDSVEVLAGLQPDEWIISSQEHVANGDYVNLKGTKENG